MMKEDRMNMLKCMLVGAVGFGIGGMLWGYKLYNGKLLFFPLCDYSCEELFAMGFRSIYCIFMGILGGFSLALLLKDFKKMIILPLSGLLGSYISFIFGNAWYYPGVLIATPFILLVFTPLCLFLGFYYLIKGKRANCAIFLFFFLIGTLDWICIMIPEMRLPLSHLMPLHSFYLFSIVGIILGGFYGIGIKKTKEMAYFGMVGFFLGSFWLTIFYNLVAYNSIIGFMITYFLVCATGGAFLGLGIYHVAK